MRLFSIVTLLFLLSPLTAKADVNRDVDPLPCGIYDEEARPFIQKDLDTQSPNKADYTMEITTRRGKKLSVEVKSVEIILKGEREQVSVFLNGKPLAKTSHQDVPLYLEVHVDDTKYRIICVRTDPPRLEQMPSDSGQQQLHRGHE